METVLVAGAPAEPAQYRKLISEASRLVAVDSGADICSALGRVPDLAIGDFDSVSDGAMRFLEDNHVEMVRFSPDKDESDLDIALDEIAARGWGPVTITCATGGRLDHLLAVVGSVARRPDTVHQLWERDLRAWPLAADTRPTLDLCGMETSVSILALGDDAVVSCSGMRYPLDRHPIPFLGSLGLSNVIVERTASVSVTAGRVLVITSSAEGTPLAHATQ